MYPNHKSGRLHSLYSRTPESCESESLKVIVNCGQSPRSRCLIPSHKTRPRFLSKLGKQLPEIQLASMPEQQFSTLSMCQAAQKSWSNIKCREVWTTKFGHLSLMLQIINSIQSIVLSSSIPESRARFAASESMR